MADRPLNATAASLLGLLHDAPMTGWDLVATAQRRIGDFWTLTQSQVYRELAAMATAGLIEAGTPGPRDRKPYQVTAAGRAAFAEWIEQEPAGEHIRFPLLVTIMFARHLSAHQLGAMVAAHRTEHARRLDGYQLDEAALGADPSPDPFRRATLEFGLCYERAVLGWFDKLSELLPQLRSRS